MHLKILLPYNKITKCIALATLLTAVSAQAALINLNDITGNSFDDDAPVFSINSAFLYATSSVSYDVISLTSFDWLFQANDYLPYNDNALFNVGAGNIQLASVETVGDNDSSGWQTYNFASSYTGSITFGVNNVPDTDLDSTLSLRNLVTQVPAPSSAAILGLGLAGLAFRRKRQKKF
jgi:hypothetical protein